MSADLLVPILGGGAILQIHPFEDGIFSKLLFDGEQRFLSFLFPLQCLGICGVLGLGKQIQLDFRQGRGILLPKYMVGGLIQSTDQQICIHDAVKQFRYRFQYLSCGSGMVL